MAKKKIKKTLANVDSVLYAVLCPNKGFLKRIGPSYHFYDKLPRATGCFTSYEDAEASRARATEKLKELAEHPYGWRHQYNCKADYQNALDSVIVTVQWSIAEKEKQDE